jgi:proline racemase
MRTGSAIALGAIDAHAAGGLVRLIVSGFPAAGGATMAEKAAAFGRRAERLCDACARPPRGHQGVTTAVLTAPVRPRSDAGLLCRRSGRFLPFSAEALIAVSTIAVERRLIVPARFGSLQFDTEAGDVTVTYDADQSIEPLRVSQVRVVVPEAQVLAAGMEVALPDRTIRTDVVLAGEWIAIVDAESAGVALARPTHALESAGVAIVDAVERAVRTSFPADRPRRLGGVAFTGPGAEGDTCMRAAIVRRQGGVESWPSGSALAAVLTVLGEMGLAAEGDGLELEGLMGTRLRGRLVDAGRVPESAPTQRAAVLVEVAGTAWITADHEFVLHAGDPHRDGTNL